MADRSTAVARIRRLPVVAATFAMVLGGALLQGYVFELVPLVPMALFFPPAQPLDAVLFALVGAGLLALWIGSRRLRQIAAGLAAALASLVLAEYLLRIDLPIDTLFFADQVAQLARVFPGRPAPLAAAEFLLLAAPVACRSHETRPPAPGLRRGAGGRHRPADHRDRRPPRRGARAVRPGAGQRRRAATPRSRCCCSPRGVAASTYQETLVDLLTSREPGTVLLRRLLPLAVALPILFAVGSIQALRLGFYEVHVGLTVYVSLFIGVSVWAAFCAADIVAPGRRRSAAAADQAQSELALRNRLLEAEAAAAGGAACERGADPRAARDPEPRAGDRARPRRADPVLERRRGAAVRLVGGGGDGRGRTRPPAHRAAGARARGRGRAAGARRVAGASSPARRATARVAQVASHWILHRDAAGPAGRRHRGGQRRHRAAPRQEAAPPGSEARYRALVAATARIVWTTSADGTPPGDLSQWEAFTGQTGLRGGRRRLDPRDPPRGPGGGGARLERGGAASGRCWPLEHRLRRHDGEYRHMEVRAVPVLDEHGTVREWVGAHTDITDRVKAEEQLGQAQKLQAVGTLAGGVAHEVNNQLMAVLGLRRLRAQGARARPPADPRRRAR